MKDSAHAAERFPLSREAREGRVAALVTREALLTRRARDMRREMTNAERKDWAAVRGHRLEGLQFRRQHPCGPKIADFLCYAARLVVEIDAATHSKPEEHTRDAASATPGSPTMVSRFYA